MPSISDILGPKPGGADSGDGEHDMGEGEDTGDAKSLAVESVKAFFEAGEKGDYEEAAQHLAAAIEHCEDDGEDDEDGDMPSHIAIAVPMKHKG